MQITATGLHQYILLPFNTVVTRPYAFCIMYNQYAQPQKCVTKVATNYMAIYLFQELQISIQRKSKSHYEAGELMHIQSSWGIYTKQLIVCLYLTYLYKSVCTRWPVRNTRYHFLSGFPALRGQTEANRGRFRIN